MYVKKSLEQFGKDLVKQTRASLTRQGKNNTSSLYKSLDYDLNVSKNSFSFSFLAEDYLTFVDKGVKGFSSSAKAPNSPYKFGSGTGKKGGLSKGINDWVRQKRIQFKSKKGKFLSYDSTAFIIRRSVWHTGLKTTNVFTRPFELAFKRLPDDLVDAYALEIEDLLKFTTND